MGAAIEFPAATQIRKTRIKSPHTDAAGIGFPNTYVPMSMIAVHNGLSFVPGMLVVAVNPSISGCPAGHANLIAQRRSGKRILEIAKRRISARACTPKSVIVQRMDSAAVNRRPREDAADRHQSLVAYTREPTRARSCFTPHGEDYLARVRMCANHRYLCLLVESNMNMGSQAML